MLLLYKEKNRTFRCSVGIVDLRGASHSLLEFAESRVLDSKLPEVSKDKLEIA